MPRRRADDGVSMKCARAAFASREGACVSECVRAGAGVEYRSGKEKKAFFTRQAALGAEQDARRTAAMCVCASGGRSLLSVRFILLNPGVFLSPCSGHSEVAVAVVGVSQRQLLVRWERHSA